MKSSITTYFTLAAMLAVTTACQEKVAPELTDAGVATTTGGTTGGGGGSTATHNFTLTLGNSPTGNSPTGLKYQLHKANDLVSTACQVEDVLDAPDTLPSTRDINCFLEAEEANLFWNGLGFNISSDADTCDHIIYKPYSFQRWEPGMSGYDGAPRRMVRFVCDSTTTVLGASTAPNLGGAANPDNLTMSYICGRTFEVNSNTISNTSDYVTNPADANPTKFCSFDYSQRPPQPGITFPNCDAGSIHLTVVNYSATDTDADSIPDTLVPTVAAPTEATSCGGNPRLCTEGPMVELLGSSWTEDGRTQVSYETNAAAVTKSFTVASPYSKKHYSNLYAANFTRQCAGVGSWNTLSIFAGSANSYNPSLIADYAEFGVDAVATDEDSNGFDVVRLAQDPLRAGLVTTTDLKYSVDYFRSQPHYEFLCLDRAYEIKARIRMQVRDWNKAFNTATTSFAFISDVFNNLGIPYTAVMDATRTQTAPNAPWRQENDFYDWDDYITLDDSTACDTNTSATSNGLGLYPGSNL